MGVGGGESGLIGGSGGGYGGVGQHGINALHRLINSDQYLSLKNNDILLNDVNFTSTARNSSVYGDAFKPVEYGSGGGGTTTHNGVGGRGGGVIILYVQNDISLDHNSSISADGESVYQGGGGGSGGTGTGRISATGGLTCPTSPCTTSMDFPGGYGGGCRVRIDKTMERFS
eukprot:gene37074-45736_t